jgi:hypothetical protein
MKININRHLFSQIDVDSRSISALSTIVHRFAEAGEYTVYIIRESNIIRQFTINVVDENQEVNNPSQVSIDLSKISNNFILKTGGYILFYTSTGPGGYAIEMHKSGMDAEAKVFDSRELKDDDIFSTMIIRPGTYSVTNVLNNTKAELVVKYPQPGKIEKNPPPINIDCTVKEITPNKINIYPSHGLVFKCKTPSGIKIELTKPDDGPQKTENGQSLTQKNLVQEQSDEKIIRSYRIMPHIT